MFSHGEVLTGLPKTIEIRPLNEDVDPFALAKPSASGHLATTVKEEKNKKRKSSGSPDAKVRKKRVAIRIRKNKKNTKPRVPNFDSLYWLKDYPEDDDL